MLLCFYMNSNVFSPAQATSNFNSTASWLQTIHIHETLCVKQNVSKSYPTLANSRRDEIYNPDVQYKTVYTLYLADIQYR